MNYNNKNQVIKILIKELEENKKKQVLLEHRIMILDRII